MDELTFAAWIDIFLTEKKIDLDVILEVEGEFALNLIEVEVLVAAMKGASSEEQDGIWAMCARLDFLGRPILPYLAHLAQAIAI